MGSRPLTTAYGTFTAHAFRDKPSQAVHLALVKGEWTSRRSGARARTNPLSVFDALETTAHAFLGSGHQPAVPGKRGKGGRCC